MKAIGGRVRTQEVDREIAKCVDAMIGNWEDFTTFFLCEVSRLATGRA